MLRLLLLTTAVLYLTQITVASNEDDITKTVEKLGKKAIDQLFKSLDEVEKIEKKAGTLSQRDLSIIECFKFLKKVKDAKDESEKAINETRVLVEDFKKEAVAMMEQCIKTQTVQPCLAKEGVEPSMVDALKEEMETLRDELVQMVLGGSSDLQLTLNKVESMERVGMDWDVCEDLFDSLMAGEKLIAYAPQMAIQIVKNFTVGTEDLVRCVDLDPFKAFKCFIEKAEALKQLAADAKEDGQEYGQQVRDLAQKIKEDYNTCVGKTTTTTTTTAAPPTQPPTKPTTAPTTPTKAPTKPTKAPTKPTKAPTKPTKAPTKSP